MKISCKVLIISCALTGCKFSTATKNNFVNNLDNSEFPDELVNFIPYKDNPVFSGSGTGTWDDMISERDCIPKSVFTSVKTECMNFM